MKQNCICRCQRCDQRATVLPACICPVCRYERLQDQAFWLEKSNGWIAGWKTCIEFGWMGWYMNYNTYISQNRAEQMRACIPGCRSLPWSCLIHCQCIKKYAGALHKFDSCFQCESWQSMQKVLYSVYLLEFLSGICYCPLSHWFCRSMNYGNKDKILVVLE